ncbi:MAG: hypothetical protein QM734_00235 [Cyclobacteriaceae bacterium]
MRLIFTLILSAFALSLSVAQSKKGQYQYSVDLTQLKDDRLLIRMKAPSISKDGNHFLLTQDYSWHLLRVRKITVDLCLNSKLLDKKGKELSVEKMGDNGWKIKGARKPSKNFLLD